MRIAVMIPVQESLSWAKWSALIVNAERFGLSGIYLSDHFGEGRHDTIETITGLTYVASHTQQIQFGSLVSPFSFRNPVMLARQAIAISNLSGGRMVLGIGAGWQESEHTTFGYDLGDMNTRMARFEEGVHVVAQLIRSDEPITHTGRFYRLQNALLPRSQHALPIMIGGNGIKRTLPVVAKYADIWNGLATTVEVFQERSALLDTLLLDMGRKPSDVRRTTFLPVCCWRDDAEREYLAAGIKQWPGNEQKSTDEIFNSLKIEAATLTGTPETVVKQLRAYAHAGADEVMLMPLVGVELPDYLTKITTHLLPPFA